MRAVRWSSGNRVTRPGCASARGTYKSKHSCGSRCRKSSIGRNLNAVVHLNARQNVFLRAKCPTEPGQLSIYQEELSSRLAIVAKACGMFCRRLSPAPSFVLHVRARCRDTRAIGLPLRHFCPRSVPPQRLLARAPSRLLELHLQLCGKSLQTRRRIAGM